MPQQIQRYYIDLSSAVDAANKLRDKGYAVDGPKLTGGWWVVRATPPYRINAA